jgi:hypothetical protein
MRINTFPKVLNMHYRYWYLVQYKKPHQLPRHTRRLEGLLASLHKTKPLMNTRMNMFPKVLNTQWHRYWYLVQKV